MGDQKGELFSVRRFTDQNKSHLVESFIDPSFQDVKWLGYGELVPRIRVHTCPRSPISILTLFLSRSSPANQSMVHHTHPWPYLPRGSSVGKIMFDDTDEGLVAWSVGLIVISTYISVVGYISRSCNLQAWGLGNQCKHSRVDTVTGWKTEVAGYEPRMRRGRRTLGLRHSTEAYLKSDPTCDNSPPRQLAGFSASYRAHSA